MTMFNKGTWTILKILEMDGQPAPHDRFVAAVEALGSRYIPLCSISQAMHEQTTTFGLAPFSEPRLGDEEEISLNINGRETTEDMESALTNYSDLFEWEYDKDEVTLTSPSGVKIDLQDTFWQPNVSSFEIAPNVYGAWLMMFEYTDTQDTNSKKEKMAYDYGAPFKLQSADIKKQISESVVGLDALTRKHYQIVIDFNQGLVWINTAAAPVMVQVQPLLGDLGIVFSTPDDIVGDLDQDRISQVLTKLFNGSTIQDECITRLQAMKLHGPEGVEPHENATMEKILKAFYAFTEHDSWHLGLQTPASILLNPYMPTATGAKSVYEATELLQTSEESSVMESGLMFTEYVDRQMKNGDVKQVLSKRFSIQASPKIFFKEDPGLIVKGLNVENFKAIVKQHTKATDSAPTIKDYWAMYYDAMRTAVYTYFATLKDLA